MKFANFLSDTKTITMMLATLALPLHGGKLHAFWQSSITRKSEYWFQVHLDPLWSSFIVDMGFVKVFGIAPPSSLSHFHLDLMSEGAKWKKNPWVPSSSFGSSASWAEEAAGCGSTTSPWSRTGMTTVCIALANRLLVGTAKAGRGSTHRLRWGGGASGLARSVSRSGDSRGRGRSKERLTGACDAVWRGRGYGKWNKSTYGFRVKCV